MIQPDKVKEIKEIVASLNGKTLDEIAKENSVSIYTIDLTEVSSTWHVSWVIIYYPDTDKYNILVHSGDPDNRKRFTLAHELGHFFLHKDVIKKERLIVDLKAAVLYRTSENPNDIVEQEANAFAAELLMPEDIVRKLRLTEKDTDKLAEIFSVSVVAMWYRLTNLWLIEE